MDIKLKNAAVLAIAGGVIVAVAPFVGWVSMGALSVDGFRKLGALAWIYVAIGGLTAIAGGLTFTKQSDAGIVGGGLIGGLLLGGFLYWAFGELSVQLGPIGIASLGAGAYLAWVGIGLLVLAGAMAIAGGALKKPVEQEQGRTSS